jgi:putative GTP pyrophosphokinase
MDPVRLTDADHSTIEALLEAYDRHKSHITLFRDQLLIALSNAQALNRHIHSIRSRLKDLEHLRDKLGRKILKCRAAGTPFEITPDNLLLKINDLAGVRILHLYTRQIRDIDAALREIFREAQYELIEGPFARTWDDESREFFKQCGIEAQESPSMYTSVHYVIGSASRTKATAEIQVRTLSEEVWGEVDHTLNYPHKTDSVACSEQLKVLARVTSSATRLVDSIFLTMDDHRRTSRAPGTPAISPAGPPASRSTKGAPKAATRRVTQQSKGPQKRRKRR